MIDADEHTHRPQDVSRRTFLEALGAGLVVSTVAGSARAQQQRERGRRGGGGGGGGGGPVRLESRLHIGADGVITVMTGKVECGQGARAQITQAAAEELGVSP